MSIVPDKAAAPARPRGALVRWAGILLPFVFVARAIVLVFQLHAGHHPAASPRPLAWPPEAGEALRFRQAPGITAWAAARAHATLPATLLRRDYAAVPPETACLLNPVAMAAGGGTLTLGSQGEDGYWTADWSGLSTLPADAMTGLSGARGVRGEAAMLKAADCGAAAQLQLSDQVVRELVSMLSGRPPPPTAPEMPNRKLIIRVDEPAP